MSHFFCDFHIFHAKALVFLSMCFNSHSLGNFSCIIIVICSLYLGFLLFFCSFYAHFLIEVRIV